MLLLPFMELLWLRSLWGLEACHPQKTAPDTTSETACF